MGSIFPAIARLSTEKMQLVVPVLVVVLVVSAHSAVIDLDDEKLAADLERSDIDNTVDSDLEEADILSREERATYCRSSRACRFVCEYYTCPRIRRMSSCRGCDECRSKCDSNNKSKSSKSKPSRRG